MGINKIINPLEIIARLNWEEGEHLEFKSAKGGIPKSLWETYSAMANTQGGIILLGVEDDGAVSGVLEPAKIKKNFWDVINNRGKVSANLLTNADVVELSCASVQILAIRVPQASRYQRPIYLNQNPLTGTYRRTHEGDYHCTEQEVSRMLSDRAEEPADSRILDNFKFDDLDITSLQQYRQRLASHKPIHPWLSEDDKGLLTKLNGWRRDRKTEREGLTLAGLLMFGQDGAIRDAVPNYHVDYREKLLNDPAIRWTDRLTIDGTWHANLFQFYLRVIQRLAADIKLPFHLDEALFRAGETEVHAAIRETLVNALIHADYYGTGGIIIEKFPDHFVFSNPGTLLISLEQLLRGNVSECRNKSLQTMFMMIGAAEKAGSGVDKIMKSWSSQHWRSPLVRQLFRPDRVEWQLLMISLIPIESLERLKSRFGDKYQNFNQAEVQVLATADIENSVDNARMRQITGHHAADITRVLQGLVANGALIQEGQTRGSRYRLPMEQDVVPILVSTSDNLLDSVHKPLDSVHKPLDSIHKPLDSVHSKANKSEADGRLQAIAASARQKRRLVRTEMETVIYELCQNRWLSRKDLADLLGRHSDGLRARFLSPMVEHGLLKLRYPDKPNRVDQAYTSITQMRTELCEDDMSKC